MAGPAAPRYTEVSVDAECEGSWRLVVLLGRRTRSWWRLSYRSSPQAAFNSQYKLGLVVWKYHDLARPARDGEGACSHSEVVKRRRYGLAIIRSDDQTLAAIQAPLILVLNRTCARLETGAGMACTQTVRLAHVPPELLLYISLFTDVANASFLRQKLLDCNAEFEYAFVDAATVRTTLVSFPRNLPRDVA